MTTRTLPSAEQFRGQIRAAKRMPQLLELQRAIRQAMNDTADELDGADGNDQATLQALWTQFEALFQELSDKILRTASHDEWERRQAGIPIGGTGDRQWDRRLVEFRIGVAIAGSLGPALGFNVDAAPEREVSQELARRAEGGQSPAGFLVPRAALSLRARDCPPGLRRSLERRADPISTNLPADGVGGSLIPTVLDPQQWIDPLRAATKVRELGARVLSDLTANLNLPKMIRPATTAWFAENAPIIRTDEGFGDVQLRPRHCGGIVEFSRNMLLQAVNPGIEAIIRNDLAAVLARAIDSAAIAGAGGPIEPLGIINDATVPNLPAAPPTYDGLVDLTNLLADNNALDGSLGWLADATVRAQLLKLKDGYQRPYGLDLLFQGFRYEFSNIAAGPVGHPHPIIFGNWDDLVIGEWSSLDLLTNSYDSDAYSKGNILVRGAMTIDVARRHVESFAWMGTAAGGMTADEAAAPADSSGSTRRRVA
jgi:HK97 family phage major capsid protein